jgi:hypothetical protein
MTLCNMRANGVRSLLLGDYRPWTASRPRIASGRPGRADQASGAPSGYCGDTVTAIASIGGIMLQGE